MAQVKISDISVGDWVEWMGERCKVDLPLLNTVFPHAKIYPAYTSATVQPIPITPEILEKNGAKKTEFVKDSGYEFYQCDDFYASRVEGSKWWTIIVRNECREVVNCYVQHIHQLQRALRLAGIEKEIEL
jgi:hypothetical protein